MGEIWLYVEKKNVSSEFSFVKYDVEYVFAIYIDI